MKDKLIRLKKTHQEAEEGGDKKEEAGGDKKEGEDSKSILKEGWLKIHAESLLDEQTYPELLQPKTEF